MARNAIYRLVDRGIPPAHEHEGEIMLMRTDPFRELDRLAEQFFGTASRPAVMHLDGYRDGDWFYVEVDLPGVDPDSIDVTVPSLPVSSGDSIVFYTDGATDVAPPHGLTPTQLEELVRAAAVGQPDPAQIAARFDGGLDFTSTENDHASWPAALGALR